MSIIRIPGHKLLCQQKRYSEIRLNKKVQLALGLGWLLELLNEETRQICMQSYPVFLWWKVIVHDWLLGEDAHLPARIALTSRYHPLCTNKNLVPPLQRRHLLGAHLVDARVVSNIDYLATLKKVSIPLGHQCVVVSGLEYIVTRCIYDGLWEDSEMISWGNLWVEDIVFGLLIDRPLNLRLKDLFNQFLWILLWLKIYLSPFIQNLILLSLVVLVEDLDGASRELPGHRAGRLVCLQVVIW